MGPAAVGAVVMSVYALYRHSDNREDSERKRRLHLNALGRIAEGQVVELGAHSPEPPEKSKTLFGSKAQPLANLNPRQLASYTYAISGVTYHTTQYVTGLQSHVRFSKLSSY